MEKNNSAFILRDLRKDVAQKQKRDYILLLLPFLYGRRFWRLTYRQCQLRQEIFLLSPAPHSDSDSIFYL